MDETADTSPPTGAGIASDAAGHRGAGRFLAKLAHYPARRYGYLQERRFDRIHGIDTSGILEVEELGVSGRTAEHAQGYEATTRRFFRRMLAEVRIPLDEYVFVDIGSGKGKALFFADDYPFKRIVGVEFSPVLHGIAEENVRRYLASSGRPSRFELRHEDATVYEFPPEPLAVYLYNPFTRPILAEVLDRLAASLRARPRDAVVLYRNPDFGDALDAIPELAPVRITPDYRVYATPGAARRRRARPS